MVYIYDACDQISDFWERRYNKLICNAYTGKDSYIYLQMFKEYLYKYILLTLKTIYTHIK